MTDTYAPPAQNLEQPHPVVLTPGDKADAARLAAAINSVPLTVSRRWPLANSLITVNETFGARVLTALDADDTVDDAESAQLRNQLGRAKAMLIRHGYDVELADMDGGLRAALGDLREARDELFKVTRQRDEQIASHVRAHDALTRVRAKVTELVAECLLSDEHEVTEYAVMVGADNLEEAPTCVESYDDQAEAEELAQHVPGAWIASRRVHVGSWVPVIEDELVRPGESSRAAVDEPKCAYCGRTRATHQIIRTHSFVHPNSPYWLGGRWNREGLSWVRARERTQGDD